MKQAGFMLIELVMVIVILAILAAVAIPVYVDLRTDAQVAAEQGVVGGVRAGILTYFVDPDRGNRTGYPSELGGADGAATPANPLFVSVLTQGGITADWTKAGAVYTGPAGNDWTYDSGDGSFEQSP